MKSHSLFKRGSIKGKQLPGTTWNKRYVRWKRWGVPSTSIKNGCEVKKLIDKTTPRAMPLRLSWTGKIRWAHSAHRYSRRHWRNSSEIPRETFPVRKTLCSDPFLSSVCLYDSQQRERALWRLLSPRLRTGSTIWDALHNAQIKGPLLKERRTRNSGCSARCSVWHPFKPVQLTGATLHEASPAGTAWQDPFSHSPKHCFLLFIRIYFLGKKSWLRCEFYTQI